MNALISRTAGLALLLSLALPAFAQDADSGWQHEAHVYLLGPTISGTVGVAGIEGDVDVDPGDVFSALDMGFLGGWIAEKNNLGFMLDVIYMDLSQDVEGPGGRVTGEFGNKQLITGGHLLYRVSDSTQLLAGLMYTDLSIKVDLQGPIMPRRVSVSESWVDPVMGLRYATPLSERWEFSGFGFVGGFGIGSDLIWSVNALFSYRMSQRTHFTAGLRYIDYQYQSGQYPDRFKFHVAEYGPALGLKWKF